jgi:hypothetical protein
MRLGRLEREDNVGQLEGVRHGRLISDSIELDSGRRTALEWLRECKDDTNMSTSARIWWQPAAMHGHFYYLYLIIKEKELLIRLFFYTSKFHLNYTTYHRRVKKTVRFIPIPP